MSDALSLNRYTDLLSGFSLQDAAPTVCFSPPDEHHLQGQFSSKEGDQHVLLKAALTSC